MTRATIPDEPRRAGRLVLASASPTRARLLADAGIPVEAVAPGIDEEARKRSLRARGIDGAALARRLAEDKALSVDRPGRLVLGADQVLILGDRVFDKPLDRDGAARQLRALAGRTHRLVSAACIAEDGVPVWRRSSVARLAMRRFTPAFLDDYLDRVGEAALAGPGAYRVEGPGIQLFDAIDGEHAAILGLPLLALLAYLRRRGAIAE